MHKRHTSQSERAMYRLILFKKIIRYGFVYKMIKRPNVYDQKSSSSCENRLLIQNVRVFFILLYIYALYDLLLDL